MRDTVRRALDGPTVVRPAMTGSGTFGRRVPGPVSSRLGATGAAGAMGAMGVVARVGGSSGI